MKDKITQWLSALHTKTLHGVCSGVSEDQNEVASRIRFLANFRRPKAVVLALASLLLVGVGIFCLGGDNPIITTAQSEGSDTFSQMQNGENTLLSLDEIAYISEEQHADFTLSTQTQDGAAYYRFDAKEGEVYLLVNAAQTALTLYVDAQSLQIPCSTIFGGATAAPASLALQDLTGDGVEEFIFLHEDGGTAALDTTVHIIDLATMAEYPLPDLVEGVAQQVNVGMTGQSFSAEGDAYLQCLVMYQLAGQAATSFTAMVQPFTEQLSAEALEDWSNFQYDPAAQQGSWVGVSLVEAGLSVEVGLQIDNQVPWEYVANATAMLEYDSAAGVFVVGELLNVVDSTITDLSDATGEYQESDEASQSVGAQAQTRAEYNIWQADITHDGQQEDILWDGIAFAEVGNQPLYLQLADATDLPREAALWQTEEWQSPSTSHAGTIAYCLYTDVAGDDYILRYYEGWYNGCCTPYYDLFYLSAAGEEIIIAHDEVEILGEGMPYNGAVNDVDAIVAFFESVTEYSQNSYVLVSTLWGVSYYDPIGDQEIEGVSMVLSTAQQPLQVIPSFMQDYFTTQGEGAVNEEAVQEALRTMLEDINEARTTAYDEILAEQAAQNQEATA